MLRYARTLVRDPREAEDLVQDAVVRALEKHGSFRGEASLGTWLHRILHNLAVDRARQRHEDAVDTSARALLEQHLAACPTFPPLYAGLVGLRAALGGRRDPDDVIPAQILARILATSNQPGNLKGTGPGPF